MTRIEFKNGWKFFWVESVGAIIYSVVRLEGMLLMHGHSDELSCFFNDQYHFFKLVPRMFIFVKRNMKCSLPASQSGSTMHDFHPNAHHVLNPNGLSPTYMLHIAYGFVFVFEV